MIYLWVHAAVASVPVFGVGNVTDIYAASACSEERSRGHVVYMVLYNLTTVIVPLAAVFVVMALIRRALSASQKKKAIIAALRTPQSSVSIPYVSQREAELHAALLAIVSVFVLCAIPYAALLPYRALPAAARLSQWLQLTAVWLPKVSLVTNPLLIVTVNRSARRRLFDALTHLQRRYSRRNNAISVGVAPDAGPLGGEVLARSGSQLLEMFNIGQRQIFKQNEDEDDEDANEISSVANFQSRPEDGVAPGAGSSVPQHQKGDGAKEIPKYSPVQHCAYSSSQVAPATPSDPTDATQFGFGPFELPPQWLPETRNSKKRLLPPLGNTPEELIQTKAPKTRSERRISRNNKVSTFPTVDP